MACEEHTFVEIPLDKTGIGELFHPSSKMIARKLKEFFDKDLKKPSICPNCGSIQPGIAITYKNKNYQFVCIQISKSGKGVLLKTDYEQLYKFLDTEKKA